MRIPVWLREEPRRLWRGLRAMQHAFGLRFTAALLLTFGLLLWALIHVHGALAFVLGLICVLLAIRAHDLGDLPDEEPSEYDTFWGGDQWLLDEQAKLRAQQAAAEFNRIRDRAALGKPHDPAEL